jgi:hypothetical protein
VATGSCLLPMLVFGILSWAFTGLFVVGVLGLQMPSLWGSAMCLGSDTGLWCCQVVRLGFGLNYCPSLVISGLRSPFGHDSNQCGVHFCCALQFDNTCISQVQIYCYHLPRLSILCTIYCVLVIANNCKSRVRAHSYCSTDFCLCWQVAIPLSL